MATKYEGNWEKGLKHGKGILYDFIAGKKQEAIYKEGKIEQIISSTDLNENSDQTTSTTAKNNCISGDCQNGFGKVKYDNGDVYEGEFTNRTPNGEGHFKWANGDSYKGSFQNGVIEGYGIIKSKEVTYTGYLKNNFPHGEGTKVLLTGRIVKGSFQGGKLNGKGINTFANGDNSEGNYVDDSLEGFGSYVWSNGNKYEGEFKNGSMDGGIYHDFSNGKKYEVIYKAGKVIQTISTTNLDKAVVKPTTTSTTIPNGLVWNKNSENTEVWLY